MKKLQSKTMKVMLSLQKICCDLLGDGVNEEKRAWRRFSLQYLFASGFSSSK